MKEEIVFVPASGIRLEGLLNLQEAFPIKGGVICCHPHPQYGGDMHNTVMTASVEAAYQEGLSSLRFNYRGVGKSEGSYDEGVGEKDDVRAAIEYLNSRLNDSGNPILLLGYSFGAWVGLPIAVQDDRVRGIVAVAPPLEMFDFGFLKGCKKNKLIIGGDKDFYCPSHLLEEWYQQLEEPKSLILIPGADHFFFTRHRSLIPPLRAFFKNVLGSKYHRVVVS